MRINRVDSWIWRVYRVIINFRDFRRLDYVKFWFYLNNLIFSLLDNFIRSLSLFNTYLIFNSINLIIKSNRDQELLEFEITYNNRSSLSIFLLSLSKYILEFLILIIDRLRIIFLDDVFQDSNNVNSFFDIANKA